MAYTIKNLANGQLPSSLGDLYTVPSGTSAIVRSITLVNTNTTTETINIYYLQSGGTARRILPKDFQLTAGNSLTVDVILTLGAGDKIQGVTTTASSVDYVISGVESV